MNRNHNPRPALSSKHEREHGKRPGPQPVRVHNMATHGRSAFAGSVPWRTSAARRVARFAGRSPVRPATPRTEEESAQPQNAGDIASPRPLPDLDGRERHRGHRRERESRVRRRRPSHRHADPACDESRGEHLDVHPRPARHGPEDKRDALRRFRRDAVHPLGLTEPRDQPAQFTGRAGRGGGTRRCAGRRRRGGARPRRTRRRPRRSRGPTARHWPGTRRPAARAPHRR
jgi:hypothetical protein